MGKAEQNANQMSGDNGIICCTILEVQCPRPHFCHLFTFRWLIRPKLCITIVTFVIFLPPNRTLQLEWTSTISRSFYDFPLSFSDHLSSRTSMETISLRQHDVVDFNEIEKYEEISPQILHFPISVGQVRGMSVRGRS